MHQFYGPPPLQSEQILDHGAIHDGGIEAFQRHPNLRKSH
jgi:hypothetical protein